MAKETRALLRTRLLEARRAEAQVAATPPAKPRVVLVGTDGNVFALGGKVARALRVAGLHNQATEFCTRLWACHSYAEALLLMQDYVEVA